MKNKIVWTVKQILIWTTQYLMDKGCETPRLDAELLLSHVLGVDRLRLYLDYFRPLTNQERRNYRELIRRRAAREPVALITGQKEFWSLEIFVNSGVLIPRPETELLVEVVLDECKDIENCSVIEIGCGSGAVLCAIAKERDDVDLYGCDISLRAVVCTSLNASKQSFLNRVNIFASDLLESVCSSPLFNIICSNPPYIPSDVINSLAPEIRYFEPVCALDGGINGTEIIRRLIETSRSRLQINGKLIIEIGDQQSDSVIEMLKLNHFSEIRTYTDLTGKLRVIKAAL